MPNHYKRKRKCNKKKRKYKKNYKLTVPNGMPKTGRTKLRYVENLSLTGTTGAIATSMWRANSAYDPRYASGGHQPMGYDQWTTLFNHYVVVGSKITAKFQNSSDIPTTMCGIYLSADTTSVYSNWADFIEADKGNYIQTSDSERSYVATEKFSCRRFFNLVDPKDGIGRVGAGIGNDPQEGAYFVIWIQAKDAASTSTVNVTILIEYIIDFSEPKNLPQSTI